MFDLSILDWILIAILLVSTAIGAWRGLVYEVLSLLVWLFAFMAAQWWAPWVMQHVFNQPAKGSALIYAAAYVAVFVGTAFVCGFIVSRIKRVTDAIGLRPVDRVLGAVFGVVRGGMVLLTVAIVVQLTPLAQNDSWQQSVVAGKTTWLLHMFKPFFSDSFNAYLG